jgi:hypothetical protein
MVCGIVRIRMPTSELTEQQIPNLLNGNVQGAVTDMQAPNLQSGSMQRTVSGKPSRKPLASATVDAQTGNVDY